MRFLRLSLGALAMAMVIMGLSVGVAPGGGEDDSGSDQGSDQGGGGARPCPPPQGGEALAVVVTDDNGKPIFELTPPTPEHPFGQKIPKVKIVQTIPVDADGRPIADFSEYDAGGGGSIYNCQSSGLGSDITGFLTPTGEDVTAP